MGVTAVTEVTAPAVLAATRVVRATVVVLACPTGQQARLRSQAQLEVAQEEVLEDQEVTVEVMEATL